MQEFQQEFSDCWRRLGNKGIFFSLLAAWCLLFQFLGNSTFGYVDTASLFHWMYTAYNSGASEDAHGNLIPFVVLVLFWWKRKELMAVPQNVWPPALAVIALGLVLHLVGYIVQQPRISIVALFVGLYGLMGLVWGWGWLRASFFPFCLLAFCVPISALLDPITFPMRMIATSITYHLTQILGMPVIKQGTQLLDANGNYNYDVAAACSGIRSLISLLALTTIYGMITFKATWKRLLVIALSFPLALLSNVLRLTGIVVSAEAFGQNVGNFVHEWSGFLTYALAIVAMIAVGHWLREPASPETKPVLLEPQTS
jgi:exosortase